ncbi:hypothetical protein ANCCAN_03930 [Ancylostoma caninum]|uniref:Peptidase A2 domain-containing protein n=1 Tax=Ancylostoma caninum TaxID=29170 RepID=A0A368H3P9_ANCCA|nr:hypothetical protein ANCCAN_03930 [Ancylostoma caninum]
MTLTQELQGVQAVASPLFRDKSIVQLEIFGRMWPGLLDTGSEVSILSARALLQAKADGMDIDNEVAEHPIDNAMRVYDASGSRMKFITIVDVNIRERDGSDAVVSRMYVAKSDEDLMIRLNGRHRSSSAVAEAPEKQRKCYAAVVAQRAYIAPGAVGWVRLNGCKEKRDWMLSISVAMIPSGVCRADDKDVVEIPVVNKTQESAGQTTSAWWRYQ